MTVFRLKELAPLGSVLVIGWALMLLSVSTHSATFNVDCDTGDTIQQVLDGAPGGGAGPGGPPGFVSGVQPGDTILVSGTCAENVFVRAEVFRVTIDGQASASIAPADGQALLIKGSDITVRNISIVNGGVAWQGIRIQNGAAVIENAVVNGFDGNGVAVNLNGVVELRSVDVTNNSGTGIDVIQSSYAHIEDSLVQNNLGLAFSSRKPRAL